MDCLLVSRFFVDPRLGQHSSMSASLKGARDATATVYEHQIPIFTSRAYYRADILFTLEKWIPHGG
jgi:hypothetical protein